MTYLTIAEFAVKKEISPQAVNKNCRNGKYKGAYQDESGRWHIPESALQIKTKQGRPKSKKEIRTNRPLKATDSEWRKITENATTAKTSINNHIVKSAVKKTEIKE
ncbi:MAG: hypothetical protein PHD46_04695 [Eubacteriales bacterium]|nr:hypothetical protein [Eubacteriales bacterium]